MEPADFPYRWDPEDSLTPEERLGFELISSLEGRLVTDDTFRAAERAQTRHTGQLRQELDATRVLSKYNRRTWFQVLAYIALGVGNLRDVASTYDTVWWSLLYPLSSHDGGPWWLELWLRATGVLWQVAFLGWLTWRAQVPPWLANRLPTKAISEAEYLEKYGPS